MVTLYNKVSFVNIANVLTNMNNNNNTFINVT